MDSKTTKPMPTEAGIRAFHERCEAFYPADAVNASVEQQRQWYDALCAEFDAPSPEGLTRRDERVAGRIPVRYYRPAEVASGTRVFYIHGGGFVVGSLESHDAICAELAHGAQVELVSVDYRLAPEHLGPQPSRTAAMCSKRFLPMGARSSSPAIVPAATCQPVSY